MASDDEDFRTPRKTSTVRHAIGEPLDSISMEELGERIATLRAEIDRIETAMAQKRASRDAAALVFKSN
jgi:uncharacterized small protein (DUF1192 family)